MGDFATKNKSPLRGGNTNFFDFFPFKGVSATNKLRKFENFQVYWLPLDFLNVGQTPQQGRGRTSTPPSCI